MSSLNKVTLIGNAGADPTVRYTKGGDPVASFSLATSESWTDKSGQRQTATEWHRIEVFGKSAQVVRDYVTKGKSLYVEGALSYQEYTDKDGIKRNVTKIRVSGFNSRIVLLGSKGDGKPTGPTDAADAGEEFTATDEDVPFSAFLPFVLPLLGLIA